MTAVIPLVFKLLTIIVALCVCIGTYVYLSTAVNAEDQIGQLKIRQSCGMDQRVDYNSLTKFGPWDDRNYDLIAEDLAYLSPDEHELQNQLPAFFRVELRKEMPHLRKSGPAQYPRSGLQLFHLRHGELKRNVEVGNGCPKSQSDDPGGAIKEVEHE